MRLVLSCGSPNWGGLERMAVVLARGLSARGHDLVVFCRPGSPVHERLKATHTCEAILGGPDLHPGTVARCARALRRHRPDVIIGNSFKDPRWTGIAAGVLGMPFVFRQEIDEPYKPGPYYRLLYGVPKLHIVNSESTRRRLLGSAPWLAQERVVVIPNGVDAAELAAATPMDHGLPADAIVFGYTGRWEEQKGIFDLAGAWPQVVAALPQAWLVVAGWGPLEARFRQSLAGAANVRWLGFQQDMASLLKACDVLVAPSHREGFGLILVEAMAVGTPVVSTVASSIPDVVTDGEHGLLVAPRSPADLAAAMIRLGRDPQLRSRMGAAGAERVRRDFSVDVMLERHEEVLAPLVR